MPRRSTTCRSDETTIGSPSSVYGRTIALSIAWNFAWVSAIIHQHGREENRALLAKVFRALSPGGGCYGDPKTRDPERVLRDVRDGLVGVESAEIEASLKAIEEQLSRKS